MDDRKPPIRSFVLRAGRMTPGQQRGWDQGFENFGVRCSDGLLDWDGSWSVRGRRVVEIGFGMGDSLLAMAAADPMDRFLGIEVHRPGVGRLLGQALDRNINNIRVYAEDAVTVLTRCIPPASVDCLQIFFPDPWHKKRHHKRRLIQPGFVRQAAALLAPEGLFHLATDWAPYAEHMLDVMGSESTLCNVAADGGFVPRPDWRPETKFERRGERLGHGVWDLLFRRRSS